MTVSFPRLTFVELRKMTDTRAGFWLQAAAALLTLVVMAVFCIFADTEDLILRDAFALAILPASILLPIIGILLVSSEWSQRTALITFTLVPKRMRVMSAKIAASLVLGAVVMAIAFIVAVVAILAVGGSWEMGIGVFGQIALLCAMSILTGVAFGAAFLSSAPAIVLYFALPIAWGALGAIPFLEDAADWLDTSQTTTPMTEHLLSGTEWAQFAVSQALWLALPLAIGLYRIARGEIRAS
jgi:ABC-type transport system involved in multi-copper enzyme maturation permease subunit